jgi:hypothetical protein
VGRRRGNWDEATNDEGLLHAADADTGDPPRTVTRFEPINLYLTWANDYAVCC